MKTTGDNTVRMTFDEYDMYVDSAKNCGYVIADWYPTMESAKQLIENFAKNVIFILWILESNNGLALDAEKESVRKYLTRETNQRLQLV